VCGAGRIGRDEIAPRRGISELHRVWPQGSPAVSTAILDDRIPLGDEDAVSTLHED
jgi:hypothetical protein